MDPARIADRPSLCAAITAHLAAMSGKGRRATTHRWAWHGISMTHYQVMLQLEELDSLPMSRLAESLDVSLPSMTGIIDRMEAHGLVARLRDAGDRRVVLVRLSDAGRERLAHMAAMRRDWIERVLTHLDDTQLARLHAALEDVDRAFAAAAAAGELGEIHQTDTSTPQEAPAS